MSIRNNLKFLINKLSVRLIVFVLMKFPHQRESHVFPLPQSTITFNSLSLDNGPLKKIQIEKIRGGDNDADMEKLINSVLAKSNSDEYSETSINKLMSKIIDFIVENKILEMIHKLSQETIEPDIIVPSAQAFSLQRQRQSLQKQI